MEPLRKHMENVDFAISREVLLLEVFQILLLVVMSTPEYELEIEDRNSFYTFN